MSKSFLLLLSLSLTGCATHQQFDCPYKEGARCLSVGEVDKKIDLRENGETSYQEKKEHRGLFSLFHSQENKFNTLELSDVSPSSLRTPETVLRLWVAPYYTTDGAYHEDRHIHFVAREASWVGVPELGENP